MGLKERLRGLVLAGVAAAVFAAGCGAAGDGDDGGATADIASESTVTSTPADETPESDDDAESDDGAAATADDDAAAPADDDGDADAGEDTESPVEGPRGPADPFAVDTVYDGDASPLLDWFTAFEPGTYRTGAIGTPLSFTTEEPLSTQPNGSGMFVLSNLSSRGPDDHELLFLRIGNFSDPAAPNVPVEQQQLWPNDDFRGWLANLTADVIASEPLETSVNGLPAITAELRVSDDAQCGYLPGACIGFVENHGQEGKALNKQSIYRVWVIEQGVEDPLLMVHAVAREVDSDWFARAEAVTETIAFGEIEPNPITPLVPGAVQLPSLGGIEITVPDDISERTNGSPRFIESWNGRDIGVVPISRQNAWVYFADRPHDLDANPLETVDEVIATLNEGGVLTAEVDPTIVDGAPTRVFDLASANPWDIVLRFGPLDLLGDSFGWDAPLVGRAWLIEHPDRGLMMISSHALEEINTLGPQVNELAEALVSSMTFVG